MNEYFKNRRTIRQYTDREVPDSLIEKIVDAAAKAPTCGTMQLYTVIATKDPEVKAKLQPLHFNQPAVLAAPVILTICADFNRFSRWCEISDAAPGYDNFMSFMLAMQDALIMTQQITTIAEMEGLGTCFLGTVLYNAEEISEVLELPKQVLPVACLTLGRPDEQGVETERIALKGILHKDKYQKFSDEEIREIYRPKDEYPENAKFIAENDKKTLAQVYTDVRYPRTTNELFSAKLSRFLAEKF